MTKFAFPPLPTMGQIIKMYGLSAKQKLSQNFILDFNLIGTPPPLLPFPKENITKIANLILIYVQFSILQQQIGCVELQVICQVLPSSK